MWKAYFVCYMTWINHSITVQSHQTARARNRWLLFGQQPVSEPASWTSETCFICLLTNLWVCGAGARLLFWSWEDSCHGWSKSDGHVLGGTSFESVRTNGTALTGSCQCLSLAVDISSQPADGQKVTKSSKLMPTPLCQSPAEAAALAGSPIDWHATGSAVWPLNDILWTMMRLRHLWFLWWTSEAACMHQTTTFWAIITAHQTCCTGCTGLQFWLSMVDAQCWATLKERSREQAENVVGCWQSRLSGTSQRGKRECQHGAQGKLQKFLQSYFWLFCVFIHSKLLSRHQRE